MLEAINKTKKIGVTGADGFIGTKLCQTLEGKGYVLIKYNSENLDIKNKIEISKEIDILYHLAAVNKPYFSKKEPFETFETNVLGTINLLEAVRNSNVKKIIFTSSILVYNDLTKTKETDLVGYNGIYPYGFEKLIGEEYIKIYSELFGFDYAILRISGAYGPRMHKNPIFDLIQGFLNDDIKLYVNKNSFYNFVYIDDIIDALIMSMNWRKDTINVCSDENIKIGDIYKLLKKVVQKELEVKDTKFLIKILGNNEKIKKMGWKINYPLKKGLVETYNYLLTEKKNEER